ncbi:hypothetical protein Tsubulata_029080 [Turnera subulata]|uniref:Major facilitator superfamily (MFS) profile domain-containing protein n=1 Tax=Turnera subulata TaxID=218843 RepID=A0A9Q0GIY2_9ROSI|nr:hypothetical protein Tsubulata_029080 [Turnera subulata]
MGRAISNLSGSSPSNNNLCSTLLMEQEGNSIIEGTVDHRGQPAQRSSSGGWRSACFIIGVEMTERFAYYGISLNLITYLTGHLGQSTAAAAVNVNVLAGTATLLPLLGAFVADSFLGRFRTIIAASVIYVLGLGLLTLSAVLNSVDGSDCKNTKTLKPCSPPWYLVLLFFCSLYLIAVGVGGHKPCVQAFGADQFDPQDPKENKAKSSFFNWWYFGLSVGALTTLIVSVYIQDNLSWSLGFGIPCCAMIVSLLVFLLGSRTYRYTIRKNDKNPFTRIFRVVGRAIKRNWQNTTPAVEFANEEHGSMSFQNSKQFKFLDKALLRPDGSMEDQNDCSIRDVEETRALLRLAPIWVTGLAYAVVFAQTSTFFTKQGATMERTFVSGLQIPAASLQSFIGVAIILFVPLYDRIFVPISRSVTGKHSGITILQRIGAGMVLSILSMVTAALVEKKRLGTAEKYGLVDQPNVTLPISVWWLIPQYVLCGLADVLAIVGLQEFFYDEVPEELRSLGMAFYHSLIGVGSFLSSFLVSVINKATAGGGRESWFANNLNRAHLDYFYWFLAGLSAVGFSAYLHFANKHIHNRKYKVDVL